MLKAGSLFQTTKIESYKIKHTVKDSLASACGWLSMLDFAKGRGLSEEAVTTVMHRSAPFFCGSGKFQRFRIICLKLLYINDM